MEKKILDTLSMLEVEQDIHVLFACEAGERGYGFAAADSAYDVRFIYRRNLNSYLSLQEGREVCELTLNEEMQFSGLDLRKALRLFYKSNSPLYEWLQSPIVYREDTAFANELRQLKEGYFSRRAGCHHYLTIATNTYQADLKTDMVPAISYFHALRPLLACLWIIERETVPPMEFAALRTLVPDLQSQAALDELIIRVSGLSVATIIPCIPVLDQLINGTLKYCQEQCSDIKAVHLPITNLDELFRSYATMS